MTANTQTAQKGLGLARHGEDLALMLIYTVGRSHLLELFHSELQSDLVRMVDDANSRRTYEQLMNLETEIRDSGIIYKCLSGQHDHLGTSCAMLAWAARDPHLRDWMGALAPRWSSPPQRFSWAAFT